MPFKDLEISGLKLFEPKVFNDERGYFFESYNQRIFNEAAIKANFVQDNQSYSTYGTLRGLHFQTAEHAQAKLVRVIKGRVLDVAVDLRTGSETFGKHVAVELSDENHCQLYMPRGFAHGFVVLSDDAIFSYKCDNFYCKEAEGGLNYADPELNIDWQVPKDKHVVNARDAAFPTLSELREGVYAL